MVIDHASQGAGCFDCSIQDDGDGIAKEDFNLLCERFCTSKLKAFGDLTKEGFGSFGFRGEALASIDTICEKMVLRSLKKESAKDGVAWQGEFVDGKLMPGSLRPSAGVAGTTVKIVDLFHRDPFRKSKLRSFNEEYQLIVQMRNWWRMFHQSPTVTVY